MSYDIVKFIVILGSILMTMYGLSCFNYEHFILKGNLKQFYLTYIIVSLAIGYMLASFILDFMTIHF